jgi:hypothetical protein
VSSLADILRLYGTDYQNQHRADILPSHLKTMRDVILCRTPELGGQTWHCDLCGKIHYSYHSCRNRHCPKCQHDRGRDWLEHQIDLLLPVPYFMATVTVPEDLRLVFRHRQKQFYSVFFKASAKAIMVLAQDKRFLGADIGLIGVLQTWTRMIAYHPHIHFLIPGGGVVGKRWKWAKPDFLVHVKPLSRLIRRYFREALKQSDFLSMVPDSVWRKDWVCHIEPVGTGEAALKYLAPYIFRVAVSDRNILSFQKGQVHFDTRIPRMGNSRPVLYPLQNSFDDSFSTSCPEDSSRCVISAFLPQRNVRIWTVSKNSSEDGSLEKARLSPKENISSCGAPNARCP